MLSLPYACTRPSGPKVFLLLRALASPATSAVVCARALDCCSATHCQWQQCASTQLKAGPQTASRSAECRGRATMYTGAGSTHTWRATERQLYFDCPTRTRVNSDSSRRSRCRSRGPSGGCRGDLISTSDSGYYRVFYQSFLWGNLHFGGCFEKPNLQALFWYIKLRCRQQIGKVAKRRRSLKPTCANGGTNRTDGGTIASFCTSGDFQFFLACCQICFEFESPTMKREKKKKERRNRKTVAKGKDKRFL